MKILLIFHFFKGLNTPNDDPDSTEEEVWAYSPSLFLNKVN